MAEPKELCYRCYHCTANYRDVMELFMHNKDAHSDINSNFSILCGEVGSTTFKALHFSKPISHFPPNVNVRLEAGKLICAMQTNDPTTSPPSKCGKQSETPLKSTTCDLSETLPYSVSASDIEPDLNQLASAMTISDDKEEEFSQTEKDTLSIMIEVFPALHFGLKNSVK